MVPWGNLLPLIVIIRLPLLHWGFCVKTIKYILDDQSLYLVIVSAKLEINMRRSFRPFSR